MMHYSLRTEPPYAVMPTLAGTSRSSHSRKAAHGRILTFDIRTASLAFSLYGDDRHLSTAQLKRISPHVLHSRYFGKRTSVRLVSKLIAQDRVSDGNAVVGMFEAHVMAKPVKLLWLPCAT
jgi:hypothetical protein